MWKSVTEISSELFLKNVSYTHPYDLNIEVKFCELTERQNNTSVLA